MVIADLNNYYQDGRWQENEVPEIPADRPELADFEGGNAAQIIREMKAVYEYLTEGENSESGDENTELEITYGISPKGSLYAKKYQGEQEIDGSVYFIYSTLIYNDTKETPGQDEFVYQREYCDANGNSVKNEEILGFYLVTKTLWTVIDENTTEWH